MFTYHIGMSEIKLMRVTGNRHTFKVDLSTQHNTNEDTFPYIFTYLNKKADDKTLNEQTQNHFLGFTDNVRQPKHNLQVACVYGDLTEYGKRMHCPVHSLK